MTCKTCKLTIRGANKTKVGKTWLHKKCPSQHTRRYRTAFNKNAALMAQRQRANLLALRKQTERLKRNLRYESA